MLCPQVIAVFSSGSFLMPGALRRRYGRSLCGRRISGRVRFLGDSNGPRQDLRGERRAFVADEDITSLAAFRISARAKTLPTTASAEKNLHLRPRFATERASRPRC